jgi:MFS family permease
MGTALATIALRPGPIGLIAMSSVYCVGLMVVGPLTFELVPLFAPQGLLGTYYGFNGYAVAVGGAASALCGGWLYDAGASLGMPALPWLVALGLGLLVFAGMHVGQRVWFVRPALALIPPLRAEAPRTHRKPNRNRPISAEVTPARLQTLCELPRTRASSSERIT